METLDIVNEKDEIIGTAPREECHQDPSIIHHTVHFTLVDPKKNKVLLSQRSFKKSHDAGKHCFFGEHVLSGESYADGIKRGVKEELGFIPKKFKELNHHIFRYQNQTELVRFFVIFWEGEKIKWDKTEMESIFWANLKELKGEKYDLFEMTRFWFKNCDWDGMG